MIYKKTYIVDWGDIDFKKELKLSVLFSFFQETSSDASEELGFGIERLEREFSVAWVLMKMRVDLLRIPVLGETITIETWPLEPGRLTYDRDFLVKDAENNIIIKAISSWIIMDLAERKIDRQQKVDIRYPSIKNERAIDAKMRKLKANGPLSTSYEKMIGYSDIDFNGHLNNARYIDYIMDCFQVSEHKQYHVKSLEVHFTNEALPGEIITLKKDLSEAIEKGVYIEGINEQSNETVFRSRALISEG